MHITTGKSTVLYVLYLYKDRQCDTYIHTGSQGKARMWVSVNERKNTTTYKEIEDTESQHVKGKTDMTMKVKPVQHSHT